MNTIEIQRQVPLPMLWAKESKPMPPVDGEYDYLQQKWSSPDFSLMSTWCRSGTTGIFTDDPDEDSDDNK